MSTVSLTFTKLFSSITESTIWVAPDPYRLCWITMLAMADRRGRVFGSIPGLANRARISVEDCRAAIQFFLSPDPDSRTKEHEGRRIEEIDGGWRLLNHAKYRAIRDEEAILEAKRKYINTRRAVENVDRGRDNAEADTEAEALKPKKTRSPKARLCSLPEGFTISPRVEAWAKSKGYSNLEAHFEQFMSYVRTKQPRYADWDEALMGCIRNDWGKVRGNGKAPSEGRPSIKCSVCRQKAFMWTGDKCNECWKKDMGFAA